MGLGWHEWPLMLFTVLGQCAVGGFIVMGLALLCSKTDEAQRKSIHKGMFFIWVLLGIGFLLSMMHLGTIARALNSLNRVGESALSNEIACGIAFFALGGIYWLLAMLDKMPTALGKPWLIVAMIAGVAFIYAMSRVYQIDTVPTWHSGYTTLSFFMTAIIGGPLLGRLLRGDQCSCSGRPLAAVSVIALIVSAAFGMMQGAELGSMYSTVTSVTAMVPNYGSMMALRVILVAIGLALWIYPMVRGQRPGIAHMLPGFILVVLGEIIGRAVFYNLHMTVGVTFGG
ncbi:dimethyl sulfoxide reductase anchor subunit [Leminorella grimontii]|uniref:dimethyl sulfoxide reductase anchor subunit n=1 Tax=Leminorella grimontii TaxID=82981 RepID=UPI00207E6BC1|nr:dimethyl sulfoxide reductase anchor subunit [Leminorella grimontii]GKX59161.1 dimethyl sulfoxide reductase subunit C [Leminorella grimontii]